MAILASFLYIKTNLSIRKSNLGSNLATQASLETRISFESFSETMDVIWG